MGRRFRVNSPRVMYETIEGEVILIDLTTGSYYSLRDTAAEIWQALESDTDEGGICDALECRYEGSREEIHSVVGSLLDELAAEGLIELVDSLNGGRAASSQPSPNANGREPFRAPVVEKHSDMQDLILLDPVHEVDPQGWPHAAQGGASDRA